MHVQDSDEPIICESAAMARFKKQLDEITHESFPILITGEAGTGKFFIARKIRRMTAQPDEPFIVLDCQQLDEDQADTVLFGARQVQEFAKRDSRQGSHLQVQGALHLADKGTIVLRHIDHLGISSQKSLSVYLDALAASGDIFPQVHVIATTSEDMTSLARAGRFHRQLAEQLGRNVLEVPPLRKRKRDILSLARLFLTAGGSQRDASACHFAKSAEHALLSAQYQHRNVTELREAVELAVNFAEGGQVDAEHIFMGPKSQSHALEHDLTPSRLVQWLIQISSLRLLQGVVLAFFLAIIVFWLTTPGTITGRVANTLVWAAWWPGLLLLFFFVGRVWCTVCPISSVGRISRLLGSLKRNPPASIKNHTDWIMAVLFLIIVCASQCTSHDCFKGSETESGCPVYHHPA